MYVKETIDNADLRQLMFSISLHFMSEKCTTYIVRGVRL